MVKSPSWSTNPTLSSSVMLDPGALRVSPSWNAVLAFTVPLNSMPPVLDWLLVSVTEFISVTLPS